MRRTIVSIALIAGMLGVAAPSFADDPLVEEAPVCGSTQQKTLWPPNHKFKSVALPTATDPEGGELTASTPTVFQDEPVNGTGDGDTSPDARYVSGSTKVDLRGERAGTGDGRFYHVTVTFTDIAGLTVDCSSTVVVPHDKSQTKVKKNGKPSKKPLGDQGSLYNSFG
jgi:hypothetical protein